MKSSAALLLCACLAAFPPAQAADAVTPSTAVSAVLPTASRIWDGADYEALAQALEEGRVALPRYGRDSDALMRRLVSTENLRLQANPQLPMEYRMLDFARMASALPKIYRGYAAQSAKESGLHAELAAMLAFMVRLAASGSALVPEFMASVPRDEYFENRLKGLEKIKAGITMILIGAEAYLDEPQLTAEDKSLILVAMADSIEAFKPLLAADVKAELRQKLEKRRNRPGTGAADAASLDRLIRALGS